MNALKAGYIIIGILILILLAYYAATSVPSHITQVNTSTVGSYPVMVALSDPPYVPNGTQALNLSYSGVRVHIIGKNVSQWINSGASGSVDLLSLVNISKVLSTLSVPANSEVDMLAFNITSLSIFINSTKYPVAVPNNTIMVHLSEKVNQSSSIIADFEPTVVTIITNTSQPVFVLVPSVKAVIIPGISSSAKTGYIPVNATVRKTLRLVAPNITIVSASLSSEGNTSHISVTVRNNGNQSVVLRNLLIFGEENMTIYFDFNNSMKPIPMSVRQMPIPANISPSAFNGLVANISSVINLSSSNSLLHAVNHAQELEHKFFALNESDLEDLADEIEAHARQINITQLQEMLKNMSKNVTIPAALAHMNKSELEDVINNTFIGRKMEIEHEHFRVLNFLIAQNGSLVLPFTSSSAMNEYYRGGYILGGGNTITLSFNGNMTLGNSNVVLAFENGQSYRLVVVGERGAHAEANVTAS